MEKLLQEAVNEFYSKLVKIENQFDVKTNVRKDSGYSEKLTIEVIKEFKKPEINNVESIAASKQIKLID